MTEEQYLLLTLMEECVEVAKVASKASRFGIQHKNPELQTTNHDLLIEEFCDVCAVFQMLVDAGFIKQTSSDVTMRLVAEKKAKVLKMMEYSRSLGRLE